MNKKNIIISLTKLISVGFIAKILSTLAKIIITREIGVDSMSIYSLSLPTMILLLNLAQAGFPTDSTKQKKCHQNNWHGINVINYIEYCCWYNLFFFSTLYC